MPIILGRKPGGTGGGGAPSGPAGGNLTGTYPNPTIGAGQVTATMVAADVATQAELDAISSRLFWDAVVRKTADEGVTSSTALQNDNELFFPIIAQTNYYYELIFQVTSGSATSDMRTDFALSAGSVVLPPWRQHVGLGSTTQVIQAGQVADITTIIEFATGSSVNSVSTNRIIGYIRGDTNANFHFRWAQRVSDPSATTVLAGSTLAYRAMV